MFSGQRLGDRIEEMSLTGPYLKWDLPNIDDPQNLLNRNNVQKFLFNLLLFTVYKGLGRNIYFIPVSFYPIPESIFKTTFNSHYELNLIRSN